MGYGGQGGGTYQRANPVTAAIDAFADVDRIFENQRQRDIADEERRLRQGREAIQWEQQQEKYTYDKAKRDETDQLNLLDSVNYIRESLSPFKGDEVKYNTAMSSIVGELKTRGQNKLLAELMKQEGITPEQIAAGKQRVGSTIATIAQLQGEEDPVRQKALLQGAMGGLNEIAHSEIQKGGARPGVANATKRISNVYPLPDGSGRFVIELEVNGVDEKTGAPVKYNAPLTQGRGSDGKDLVKFFSAEEFMDGLDEVHKTYDLMDAIRLSTGDEVTRKKITTDKENKKLTAIVGGAASLFDPAADFTSNYQKMFQKITADNPGTDPTKVDAAVRTFIELKKGDIANQRGAADEKRKDAKNAAEVEALQAQAAENRADAAAGGKTTRATRVETIAKIRDRISKADEEIRKIQRDAADVTKVSGSKAREVSASQVAELQQQRLQEINNLWQIDPDYAAQTYPDVVKQFEAQSKTTSAIPDVPAAAPAAAPPAVKPAAQPAGPQLPKAAKPGQALTRNDEAAIVDYVMRANPGVKDPEALKELCFQVATKQGFTVQ